MYLSYNKVSLPTSHGLVIGLPLPMYACNVADTISCQRNYIGYVVSTTNETLAGLQLKKYAIPTTHQ